jgi:DNA repair protein RecO (recombination protein O)
MSQVSLQPGFVLHTRAYRDSSLIVELFTPDHGRLSLLARGARSGARKRSPQAALLQPFNPLLLSFAGRGDMKNLRSLEAAAARHQLAGATLFSGLYLNELLMRLLHRDDPHPGLYRAYASALASLAAGEVPEDVLRQFEFSLLDELGYGFDLLSDGVSGAPLDPGARYMFHAEHGLVRMPEDARQAEPVFPGELLLAIAAGERTTAARKAAKQLMRAALAPHLGGKPLRSRELFRSRRRTPAQAGEATT